MISDYVDHVQVYVDRKWCGLVVVKLLSYIVGLLEQAMKSNHSS